VELRLLEIKRGGGVAPRQEPLLKSSAYYWSGLLLSFLVFQVMLFGALTLLGIVYVNFTRWIRPSKGGLIYRWVTVAENYLPVMLFSSCVGVYLIYAPYAYNFRHYMAVTEEIHSVEPFTYNVFPSPWTAPGFLYLPIENAFRDYIFWALLGIAVVAALGAWDEWTLRKQQKGA